MSTRRMFTKKITESDYFLDMPSSTQCLYFHLNMSADDDGFINNPKKIQRMVGVGDDDMKLLIAKNFIIPFDNGVIVIKHWLMHNLIRKDRYSETDYIDEKKQLEVKKNKAYSLVQEGLKLDCQPNDTQMATVCNPSIGKVRLGKGSLGELKTSAQSDLQNPSIPTIETIHEPIIFLTLNDKSEYAVSEEQLKEWQKIYPSVNVMQELRKMKGWLNANPKRRKTKNGINRFVTNWLSREQDNPKRYQQEGERIF